MKRTIIALMTLCLTLSGCSAQVQDPQATQAAQPTVSQQPNYQPSKATELIYGEDVFSSRDMDGSYSAQEAVTINLQSNGISCDNGSVEISGTVATIIQEGVYLVSGSLEDGSICVDAPEDAKVQLVLSNARIHSRSSAAIYVRQADKVFLTLEEGTQNTLSNGGTFEADGQTNLDGVIFSREDLTIQGEGSLTVDSPAGHGVVSKDSLTLTGGTIDLHTAAHGITAKKSLAMCNAALTVESGKDGITAKNEEDGQEGWVYIQSGSIRITSQADAVSAGSDLQVDGGEFTLTTGGGAENAEIKTDTFQGGPHSGGKGGRPFMGGAAPESSEESQEDTVSAKGLKAGGSIAIRGGQFTMDCVDDGFHANADLTIDGGIITLASGDDALHAEEALSVLAGNIVITQSYEGLEGSSVLISGGEITLKASDDGINAAGGNEDSAAEKGKDPFGGATDNSITISGGSTFVDADGDGIDSNGDLIITGGQIIVEGPTNGGNGALDYGGKATVSGGIVIITGSIQMAQTIQSQGQGVLGISLGQRSAGTAITVCDGQGNVVLNVQPSKDYACLVASCPELVSGEQYMVTVGSDSGKVEAK